MYAIVDVKDKQFKVREDDTLYVPYHSDADEDQDLTLDRVLLVSDEEGDVTVGTPTVEDASVSARVLEHVKGDKVIVFKKKRRKRYRVKRGHRQQYTQIKIESLNVNGAAPSSTDTDETAEPDTDEPADEVAPEAETAEAKEETSSDEAEAEENEGASDDEPVAENTGEENASDEADTDDEEDADTDSSSEDNPFDQETAFDDIDDDVDADDKK
jgi:large subunit ribosomal protein L21